MPPDPEQDPVDGVDDEDSFLKPGGAFEGPLWQELLSEPSELEPGARLGPYEIRAPIAAGGMGEVYRAFDTRLAREVALKVLPRHALDSPEAMTRFQREARAVAALNHPNILAIHDVGSDNELHFAITELLEGDTLRARLDGGPLAPSKAIEYAAQIAHGLAAAHDRGIVHRDLKPENVFVTRAGRVKILDFGIALDNSATFAESDPTIGRLTQTGSIVGTVGYVSPEQVLGNPATFRSDLFALGVVMYEMLTGTHPFKRATTPETQTAILREDPPSIARAVPGLPPPVVRLIDLCLQKQPADRPESARDLALFLEASSNVTNAWLPASAVPEGTLSLPPRLRTQLLVVACGFLVLLTAVSWGLVRFAAGRAVAAAIEADFARAERAVKRVHTEHVDRLALTARLVASFPELKALFGTDVSTIKDFLLGFQQRFPRAPVLVAIGRDGTVLGRTDSPSQGTDADRDDWLAAINVADNAGAVIAIDKRLYFAVGAASEAAATIFGYVVAAEAIDQPLALALSEAIEDELLLLSEQSVLASTLRDRQTPWASLKAWQASGGGIDRFINTRIGTQRYAAREVSLSAEPAVSIVILKSRTDIEGPYGDIERGLVMIGIIAISLVLLGGRWWPPTHNEEKRTQDNEQTTQSKTAKSNGA